MHICTVVEICTNLLSDSCGQLQAHYRHNVLLHPVGGQRSSLDAKVLLIDQSDPLDHVLLGVRAQGFCPLLLCCCLSLFFIFLRGLAGISKLVIATFLAFMASLKLLLKVFNSCNTILTFFYSFFVYLRVLVWNKE